MFNLLSDVNLTNCSIEESSTSNGNGAAIYNDISTIELLNCALVGNTAFSLQGDGKGTHFYIMPADPILESDIDEILSEHIANGRPVARLMLPQT